jgi:hypothetical protein
MEKGLKIHEIPRERNRDRLTGNKSIKLFGAEEKILGSFPN